MKILHVSSATERRGGENQVLYLLRGLLKLGADNMLVLPRNCSFKDDPDWDIPTQLIRFSGEIDLFASGKLKKAIKEYEPDIIHAHTAHAHAWAAAAKKRNSIPLVVSRRVVFPLKKNPLSKWKLSKADMYICVSDHVAEVLIESGVSRESIRVVPDGVPIPSETASDNDSLDFRRRYGIPEDTLLISNLAALVPNKDHITLVDAVSALVKDGLDVYCIIAGEGRCRKEIEQWISYRKLEKRVFLVGYIENTGQLLKSSDIFVLSSKNEGLSTATLEAMIESLPVVATRCGGVEEIVESGITGLLVEPGDPDKLSKAIAVLVKNMEIRKSMGEQGKIRSRLYSIERMASGTLKVYKELL